MTRKYRAVLLGVSIILPALAFGSGYALYEGSASSVANAPGVAAKGGDPSAVYLNPAAAAGLPGTQVQIGLSGVLPAASIHVNDPYSRAALKANGDTRLWALPSGYVTHQLNDIFWFTFGCYTRFGLGAEFPQCWPGRYNDYKALIHSFDFSPGITWKVCDSLSLSAGVTVRYFDIELAQKIDAGGLYGLRTYQDPAYSPYDVDQDMKGDDIALGYDLGLQFKPCDSLYFGLAYHSRIKLDLEGDGVWTKPSAVEQLAPAFFNNTGLKCTTRNPDEVIISVAWDATDRLTLSAGMIYTHWALFDEFNIALDKPILPGKNSLNSIRNWHDAYRFSVGAEYDVDEDLRIRGSYTYDESPLNSTTLDYIVPGDNRHQFAIGFGRDFGPWTIDLCYFYELVCDKTVRDRPGTGVYSGKFTDTFAHCVAASFTRRF